MARQFDGSTSNYLNTELHAARGSTSNFSAVFALKLTAQAAAVSVFGSVDGGGDGFGFRVNQSGSDTLLQLHNNAAGRSPDAQTILDLVKFIAVVNDVSGNECRFYMGSSPANMALLNGVGTALTFSGNAMPDMVIGARNNNGTIQEPLTGILDQFSIYFDQVLTLDQIKLAAFCGAEQSDIATRYYKLDGSSPETDSSAAADHAVIVGTVADVTDICEPGEAIEVAKVVQVIESITNGLAIAKVVQVIEYFGNSLELEETLFLTDDANEDGIVFSILPIKYILETLHLSEFFRNLSGFKILLLETLNLTDFTTPLNVGVIQIITQVFTKPLKFLMRLSRRLFFGGADDGDF